MEATHMFRRGFTLIELLVVIAIIGVLSSVVLSSINKSRASARDAKRKEDMLAVQAALEMYYFDNGAYPITNTWSGYNTVGCGIQGTLSGASGWIPNLAPAYMPMLPYDPSNINGCWNGYLYYSNGINYKLLSHGLPESYPAANTKFYDLVRPTWAWKLTNKENAPPVPCGSVGFSPWPDWPICW